MYSGPQVYNGFYYNRFGAGYIYNKQLDPYLNEQQKKTYLCGIVFSWISKVILAVGIIMVLIGYITWVSVGVLIAGWVCFAFGILVLIIAHIVLRCHVHRVIDLYFYNQYRQQQAQIQVDHTGLHAQSGIIMDPNYYNNTGVVNNGFQQYPTTDPSTMQPNPYLDGSPPSYAMTESADQPPAYGFATANVGSYPVNDKY